MIGKLIIRLPDGRRVERQFDADEQLAAVYAWAECCGEVRNLSASYAWHTIIGKS